MQVAALFGIDQEQFATAYLLRPSSFILMILVPPILTMRCFAEEKRTGSIEVLLTAPVRDHEIVVGKWLASVAFFGLLWLPTLFILLALREDAFLGADLAFGPTLSGYLGIALVGSLLLAVGCFTSSLTDNQLLASLAAMLFAALLLFVPGFVAPHLAESGIAQAADTAPVGAFDRVLEFAREEVLIPLVRQVDVLDHLTNWFFRGVINSAHVVFYVVGTAVFLFLTTRSLEARRWR